MKKVGGSAADRHGYTGGRVGVFVLLCLMAGTELIVQMRGVSDEY